MEDTIQRIMESENTETTGLSSGSWRARTRSLDYPADHGARGRGDWTIQRIIENEVTENTRLSRLLVKSKDAETGISSGSWSVRTLRLDYPADQENEDTEPTGLYSGS
jgi:hypothetical protein